MPLSRLMLDTNTASYIIKGRPAVIREHLRGQIPSSICISAITEAELLLGLAKKPDAGQLALAVKEFLLHVDILPWNSEVARAYANLRAKCEAIGRPLGTMDMLIAAHSVAVEATLVTSDKAFFQIQKYLSLQDWTQPLA